MLTAKGVDIDTPTVRLLIVGNFAASAERARGVNPATLLNDDRLPPA
jgi:hypothetical protein